MGLHPNIKTKKLLNMRCHNKFFGVPAEWHFFVTSHGKRACDGVGDTLEKLAATN
jgi:hypothetical protein